MQEMNYWWIGIIIGLIGITLAAAGVPTILAIVLGVLIGGGLSIYLVTKKEEEKKNCISYRNKTLYLKQRNRIAGGSIIIKRFYKVGAVYKPAEIVYSGMTVGGVSVGSAHINEAHYETRNEKTDKFLMYYEDDSKPIEKIVCSFDIPQDSSIKKYCIDKNTIVIKQITAKDEMNKTEKEILLNNMASGNQSMAYHIVGEHFKQKYLSKNDCQTIKSWVSGEIN